MKEKMVKAAKGIDKILQAIKDILVRIAFDIIHLLQTGIVCVTTLIEAGAKTGFFRLLPLQLF